jgi:hypothetical protein
MVICKFVGGSLDGDEREIHPLTNYRIRVRVEKPRAAYDETPVWEIYEFKESGKFHFTGYENSV